MKRPNIHLVFILLVFIIQQKSFAQYNVSRSVFSNGVASLSNNNFAIKGMVGYFATGKSSNDVYYLNSGVNLLKTDPSNRKYAIPVEYVLHNNFPNPFNPTTQLRYDLPERAFVQLIIYDLLGRQVTTLINRVEEPGHRSVIWNGTDPQGKTVSAGVYFYQIHAGDYTQTRKMVVIK